MTEGSTKSDFDRAVEALRKANIPTPYAVLTKDGIKDIRTFRLSIKE